MSITLSSSFPKGGQGRQVLVLLGATAVGKTQSALECFADPRLPEFFGAAEIVSADSIQAYRGLDIGSAKPSPAERTSLPHHLIDIKEIHEQYSASEFLQRADAACAEIHARNKLPIIMGGTGFYVKSFLYGLSPDLPFDARIRQALEAELAEYGAARLYEELGRRDPESYTVIHPNDSFRIVRALEIVRSTGRPRADFRAAQVLRPLYNFKVVLLWRPRAELYTRIRARVQAMLAAGLLEEIAALKKQSYTGREPGLQAIGYKEFFDQSYTGQEQIIEKIEQHSCNYAKRQETFFRSLPVEVTLDLSAGQGLGDLFKCVSV